MLAVLVAVIVAALLLKVLPPIFVLVAGPAAARPRSAGALAPLGANAPPLVVEPLLFVMRLASEVPMPQMPSGWERLDRTFVMRCEDPAFAGRLIDEPMGNWLGGLGGGTGVEGTSTCAHVWGP